MGIRYFFLCIRQAVFLKVVLFNMLCEFDPPSPILHLFLNGALFTLGIFFFRLLTFTRA